MMKYRKATREDLERLWDANIADHPGDTRWERWKEAYMGDHLNGLAATFAVLDGDVPVGEGTLLFSPECGAVRGRTALADGVSVANVNALRIRKEYEGRGYVSAMMRLMEQYAAERGYQRLTIGVEAQETRNLSIYLHWGFRDFVMAEPEDGVLVLYYAKELNQ